MTWRSSWPPLLVLAVLMTAAAADLLLPGTPGLSQARATALGAILTAALGVIAFLLQAGQGRRSQRLVIVRAAYRSMIGATQAMLDQQRELMNFPFGHPYPGIVSNINMTADYYRHDPFEEAKALEVEWRRLYAEGERDLLLETDRNDEVLVAWRQVRKSFYAWLRRLNTFTEEVQERAKATKERFAFDLDDDSELPGLDRQLRSDIDGFAAICRNRIKALR